MLKQISYITIAAALMISGCSSDGDERRQAYLDADYYTRLEIPPDLTSNVAKGNLNFPKPTDKAMAKFKKETENIGLEDKEKLTGDCR